MKTKSKYLPLVTAAMLFLLGMPYFVWNIPHRSLLDFFVKAALVFVFLSQKKKLNAFDKKLIILYTITWLYSIFLSFAHGLLNINGIIMQGIVCGFCLASFTNLDFSQDVIEHYINIYSIIISLSLVFWILAILGVVHSYGTISHYNSSINRSYTLFPFVVIEHVNLINTGIRFSGPFDEPGVIGTISSILLCIQKFNLKDWRNLVILISGLVSMSFFFYLFIAVYWVIYMAFKKKKLLGTILLVISIFVFYRLTDKNDYMHEKLYSRFEWDSSTHSFVGDNRMSESGEEAFSSIRGTSEYFWGVNDIGAYWEQASGSSSYKNIIAMYGIIFFIMYCSFFILLGYKNNDRLGMAFFLALFFACMYQRANLYYLDFMFLFSCFARNISNNKARIIVSEK